MNQLALFEPPAFKLRRPAEPILRSAIIEGDCRLELRRQWGGGPCVVWVGLNPSTADGAKDDPTMWREMAFSLAWGFGSLIKVNLYSLITSKPSELRKWLRAINRDGAETAALRDNYEYVLSVMPEGSLFMAAWGAGANRRDVAVFLEEMELAFADEERLVTEFDYTPPPVAWHCLGTTSDGSPTHTLARGKHRIPDDQKPLPWALPPELGEEER